MGTASPTTEAAQLQVGSGRVAKQVLPGTGKKHSKTLVKRNNSLVVNLF